MNKIAYFIEVSGREGCRSALRRMMYEHSLAVSISGGPSPEMARYLKERGIVVQDFWEAHAQGVFEFPGDQRYFLNDMHMGLPGRGLLEVLYWQDIRRKPYTGDLVLWRPITREDGDELSTALTVAELQSYGFKVLGEYGHEITHESVAPYEDIEIVGPGEVVYHGKNNARIKADQRREMDEFDRAARALMRGREQVWENFARMRWNAAENARVAALHARGWFATRQPFRFGR